MVPIPRFATWDAFNACLEDQCRRRQVDVLRGQSETIGQRLARDLASMADLPAATLSGPDRVTSPRADEQSSNRTTERSRIVSALLREPLE